MNLQRWFYDQAKRHKIRVRLADKPGVGMAFGPQLICSPVVDEASFAIAMHELGHCVAAPGPRGPWSLELLDQSSPGRLVVEIAAWDWAKSNSPGWTGDMQRVELDNLQSYQRLVKGVGAC